MTSRYDQLARAQHAAQCVQMLHVTSSCLKLDSCQALTRRRKTNLVELLPIHVAARSFALAHQRSYQSSIRIDEDSLEIIHAAVLKSHFHSPLPHSSFISRVVCVLRFFDSKGRSRFPVDAILQPCVWRLYECSWSP